MQLWAEALRSPRLLEIVREGVDEPRRLLAERLAAAQAQGDLPAKLAPDAVARVIIALFQALSCSRPGTSRSISMRMSRSSWRLLRRCCASAIRYSALLLILEHIIRE